MGQATAECMFHWKVHIFERASSEVPERCEIAGKARSSLMLRSHSERGPAESVESKIWVSSEISPGFGRALCDSHIQKWCLAYIFRTQVRASYGELRSVSTQGGAGPSWMHVPWECSYFWAGFGRGAREVQNCWKSSQLFNSTWKCDEEWAISKFWQRSHWSPHEFTDSSPDLPVSLVARATFTYSF